MIDRLSRPSLESDGIHVVVYSGNVLISVDVLEGTEEWRETLPTKLVYPDQIQLRSRLKVSMSP